ncbi:hypothetical protein KBY86_08615 [Synechococcus sp. Lug-A]|uniref:hypothetical protein n=1 Tax=Synechococcus sp. Lug-A TaxID=2823740 RepID=UPI0020CE8AC8|nr:hypothetical protein [Synechococcus sp. Lug-A]MCP9846944.1 hypothetical protein [Synechococcus sp. Lug-A]
MKHWEIAMKSRLTSLSTPVKRMKRLFAVAALSIFAMAPNAQAAGGLSSDRGEVNGIELRQGSNVLLSDQNFLSSSSLCSAIYSAPARDAFRDMVFGLASSVSNSLPDGVRFVRQRFDLSPGCSARVAYTGNELSVLVSLPRNIYFTNITTPTILGQYADPAVSVDFDVVATAKVNIPSNPQAGLTLGPFSFKVSKIDPQGQNLTGDVGIGVAKLVDNLGGFGFAQQLRTGFIFPFDPINVNLSRFANMVGERGRNARLLNDYDTARKLVVLNLDPTSSGQQPIAHVSAFQGGWQTVTDQNGHYILILQITTPIVSTLIPDLNVTGQFINTDGATQYNGTLQGIIPRGMRTLYYNYWQPGIKAGGKGQFTLSNDGQSISGEGLSMGKDTFIWNGTRTQGKRVCPSGMRGENCEEMIVN